MTVSEEGSNRIPVLICGGGPIGLALAAELGWRGVRCAVIEQGDGIITTPKMNEINTRSMEFCRRWGIADAVMNCPFPADFPLDAVFVTSLFGFEIARIPRAPRRSQKPESYSPLRLTACSQHWFDPIMRRFVRSLPTVTLHHHHRLDSFEEIPGGIAVTVIDLKTGQIRRMTADYLVGCDGPASTVRRTLGIGLAGAGTLATSLNLFFRAPDLLRLSGQVPGTFFFPVDKDGIWCSLRIIEPDTGLWRLMVDNVGGADAALTPESIDRDSYLHRALGRPFKVEWVETGVWRRRSVVAERYAQGRVFLAGDSVHQVSPTGALGMNSGMGDAVDLGWKLAATIQGWGGKNLLVSYDLERRPIGERNARAATGFFLNLGNFSRSERDFDADTAAGQSSRAKLAEILVRDIGREFRTVGLQIGYRYVNSPISVPDGTPPPPDDPERYAPSTWPGARAPHAWLRDGLSTLDLFGRGFTLLRFPGAPDSGALSAAAARRDVPLAMHDIVEPEVAELYAKRLVLVRPDGHVAWRGDGPPSDPNAVIDRVRGAL
jgi:2-polyprenyl-6-methoxyphenol hydroxylase-like FAD-dependent oxidoreductase